MLDDEMEHIEIMLSPAVVDLGWIGHHQLEIMM